MVRPPKGAGRGRPPGGRFNKPQEATRKDDVYEAEDPEADEERHAERYDRVDNYEYEMPYDFDDEDIDDEMAFTEEDKKMFGHLFDDAPRAGREGGSDDDGSGLLSSGESEEEEEGSEGWSEEEEEEDAAGGGTRRQRDEVDELFGGEGASVEEGGSGDEDEDEEDEEELGAEEAAADAAAHQAMLEAVTGKGGAAAERRRRRAREVVVTEAFPESAYNLPAAAAGGELSVADLIAGLGDSKAKLGAVRKTLERLEKKAAPVSAPLPGPIRQRQERRAGYEESKKEADKWLPIVKANREAPTIRFTADKSAIPRITTTAALAARHKPETDMEAEVAALLEKAGAHSAKAVAEAEEALAMKALSVEEVRERQNRLARMRALLFYHESKAKRLKKIKSKEYRRKLKKAEKRKAAAGGEEGDEEQLRLEAEEAEFERAQERLTLKHRNTSRWARRAIKRGQTLMDDGTRAAVAEQLRLGEELRQKVNRMKPRGDDSDGSTSASEGESGSDDEGAGAGGAGGSFAGPRAGAGMGSKAKAAALELLEGNADLEEQPAKGLFALPFMQRALERKKLEAQQQAQQMLAELEGDGAAAGADPAGRAGRLAFTGTGVDQRQQWQRVARMEEGSDMESDEDEDAEAKAKRLGKQLGYLDEEEEGGGAAAAAAAERQQGGVQGSAAQQQAAAAEAAAAATAGRGAVAVTDGPISVELPGGGAAASGGKRRASRGKAAAAANGVAPAEAGKARGSAAQQDWLFAGQQGGEAADGSKKQRGKQQGAPAVSIGPAAGAAAERQQNGAAAPAAAAQQQQEEGGEAPQPAYVRSKAFAGARPGYAFKKGPQGVGYYLDGAEAVRAAKADKKREKAEAAAARRQQHAAAQQQQQQQQAGCGGGSDSEGEGHMRPMPKAGLSQAELIRRAFAGDDVQADFAAQKAAEVEGELPQEEVPGVMPGWGTWASQQREPQWVADAKRKAKQRKDAAAAARADAKLQYVVISEKWDKKSAKYKTPLVPFPFDSRETYERAMRQPLGREYNTDSSFRNLTRPAVIKDAGVIIEPIRFSKAMAQHDEQAPKSTKRAAVTTIAGGMPKKSRSAKKA
ncbi:U3 small nucleolar RNA-associated 14-like protein A isoform A [Micractinium conductrix]|uniref:U3 small nucleolar RNA-associated 14-like protein A isoform A n=1 Tax=Micractinium conductrix TaxID=554055 RepID=A0A2P6VRP3_9CHLO|nr:U3 small nucleolar RNA-associated 14-like protein A isoform A [Micractinium conductrix]|eukprot:PSC76740.1 U3 small nucleolar RNA-associated 14-like protein A isoform A [Micractinium conductrix]